MWGCQSQGVDGVVDRLRCREMRARMMPRVVRRRAEGILGRRVERRRNMRARTVRKWLSRGGESQWSGRRREVPAELMRERPAPTWIPRMTGTGTTRVNQVRRPVRLKRRTHEATKRPALAVSAREKEEEMAMLAIAFMGWTGRGMP